MTRRLAARLALVTLLSCLAPAAARGSVAILTIEEYRIAVTRIAESAEALDADAARQGAEALLSSRVSDGAGSIPSDASVLVPVTRAKETGDLRRSALSLRALARSLGDAPPAVSPPDAALLQELAAAHARAARPEGGSLITDGLRPPPLPERLRAWMRSLADGVLELLVTFGKWLWSLLPSPKRDAPATAFGPLAVVIGTVIAVLLAALLALALSALRRRREPGAPPDEPEAESGSRDADPIARSVAGWEKRARELAAMGRLREAVRAWYNGVLMTLHAGGVLHLRLGRTNWEYVSHVGDVPWRSRFAELTARFDREWYGLNATSSEALIDFEQLARVIMDAARRSPES